jgi:hypothetical protein
LESPREVAEEDTKSQEGSGNDDYWWVPRVHAIDLH